MIGTPPVLVGGPQLTTAPVSAATARTAVGALGTVATGAWMVNQLCGSPIALCSPKPVVAMRFAWPAPSTPVT